MIVVHIALHGVEHTQVTWLFIALGMRFLSVSFFYLECMSSFVARHSDVALHTRTHAQARMPLSCCMQAGLHIQLMSSHYLLLAPIGRFGA
jgi:hypothetical protein